MLVFVESLQRELVEEHSLVFDSEGCHEAEG